MSILIEDSPRNLLAWITEAISTDIASGAVITPFASPWIDKKHRRGARQMADGIRYCGGEVWFDAETHAFQMAGVGDLRYYEEYSLWSGTVGDVSTPDSRREHLRRVFEVQDTLGARHLAPTILLHHGESDTSLRALDFAREAIEEDPNTWLSVVGTAPFWASGSALDSHIGALAQLEPRGWFLTVARPISTVPVEASAEEVYGLCRTSRALSEYAPVHIPYGDLAALPAIAAGASSVGSGWDLRQRVCAFTNYAARGENSGGGGWYERPTLKGLVGSLKPNEADILSRRDSDLAIRLGPLPPPGPKEAFLNHINVLYGLISDVTALDTHEERYHSLMKTYTDAISEWPRVASLTNSPLSHPDWIDAFMTGLALYGQEEGWSS